MNTLYEKVIRSSHYTGSFARIEVLHVPIRGRISVGVISAVYV